MPKASRPLRSSSLLRRGAERSCRGAAAAKLVAGRYDRCLCVRWTRLSPQPSMPPQKHASVHDHHMLCMISPACIESRLAGMEMCSCWAFLFDGMGCRALGCAVRIGSRLATTCLGFGDAAVWEARERARPNRPLSSRVSTAVREVVFRSGLPGDPGAHCTRRPNRSVIDRACTVGDAVAPGWSRASFVDATVRC